MSNISNCTLFLKLENQSFVEGFPFFSTKKVTVCGQPLAES